MRRIESRIDTGSALYAENRAAYEAAVATLRERQQVAIDGSHGERSINATSPAARCSSATGSTWSPITGRRSSIPPVRPANRRRGAGRRHRHRHRDRAQRALGVHRQRRDRQGGSLVRCDQETRAGPRDRQGERSRRDLPRRLGGAFPPLGRNLPDKDHFGAASTRRLSAKGLPQLSVVLGGCAGGAYVRRLATR